MSFKWRRFEVRRRFLAVLLVAIVAGFWVVTDGIPPREELAAHLGALGPAAQPVSVVLWMIASLVGVPGSLLVGISVWVHGFVGGLVISGIGAVASACAAFGIARSMGRERLSKWVSERRRWRLLDEEVGRQGGRVVLLLRLLPSLPFTLLNYSLGLTRVRFATFVLATTVGILPALLVFAYAAEEIVLPAAEGILPWRAAGFWRAISLLTVFLIALPLAGRVAQSHGKVRWLRSLRRSPAVDERTADER